MSIGWIVMGNMSIALAAQAVNANPFWL